MNNIEIQELRKDTLKFFGEVRARKIDKMNSVQLEELKIELDKLKQKAYPSHAELRQRKIAERKGIKPPFYYEKEVNKLNKRDHGGSYPPPKKPAPEVSVVIPYMHTDERFKLLMACISSIPSGYERCVVELGKERKLELPEKDFKYIFINYNGVMHRGYALNVGAKHLATGKKVILLDADIVLSPDFDEKIKEIDYPAVAWSKMFYLNEDSTENFVNEMLEGDIEESFYKYIKSENCDIVKTPRIDGPAGGITIIPRDIFMELKGVPEDFEGTWGGPDNTLMAKLNVYGYQFKTINHHCMHLWHTKNTPRVKEIATRARAMLRWSHAEWKSYLGILGNSWGHIKKQKPSIFAGNEMSIKFMMRDIEKNEMSGRTLPTDEVIDNLMKMWPDGFNRETLMRVFKTKETIISLGMLSLLRTNKLLMMLDHWDKHRYIPSNIALRVQGSEKLSHLNGQKIQQKLELFFDNHYVTFTEGNKGTGVPRHEMVHKALDFDTKYIMTTDDDMFFPPGSVEAMISLLEDNPKLGAIDMWVWPNLNAWFARQDVMEYQQPKPPITYVDGMGSASMIVRREVFETCDYDNNYYVGWADIDFCMQMREAGWKMAILALPEYKALNWQSGGGKEYNDHRHNAQHTGNSGSRFHQKWKRFI